MTPALYPAQFSTWGFTSNQSPLCSLCRNRQTSLRARDSSLSSEPATLGFAWVLSLQGWCLLSLLCRGDTGATAASRRGIHLLLCVPPCAFHLQPFQLLCMKILNGVLNGPDRIEQSAVAYIASLRPNCCRLCGN